MTIKVLGIDIGKHTFHVYGEDDQGKTAVRRKFTRKGLIDFLGNLSPCLIGLEACCGGHHWARKLKELGHEAKLMPGQFVKPYVKSHKTDYLDAEAICEAVQRPTMRFVSCRSGEQQALGALIRLRESLVRQRNVTINQVHGFLLEYGIEYPKGRSSVRRLPERLSQHQDQLPVALVSVLCRIYEEFNFLTEQINGVEREMDCLVKQDERGKRLLEIPGVGIITASCLLAWVGDAKQFKSGRELAAWIGLVPKQYSTGGKQTFLGIGKRGHSRLRTNLIHGARSALQWHIETPSRWNEWAKHLSQRKHKALVTVALANKLARMIWVVLARNERYAAIAA